MKLLITSAITILMLTSNQGMACRKDAECPSDKQKILPESTRPSSQSSALIVPNKISASKASTSGAKASINTAQVSSLGMAHPEKKNVAATSPKIAGSKAGTSSAKQSTTPTNSSALVLADKEDVSVKRQTPIKTETSKKIKKNKSKKNKKKKSAD